MSAIKVRTAGGAGMSGDGQADGARVRAGIALRAAEAVCGDGPLLLTDDAPAEGGAETTFA